MRLSTRKIGDIEQRNLGGLGFASHWTVDRPACKTRRTLSRKRSRSLSSTTKKQLTLMKANRKSNEGNRVITELRNNCLSGLKNVEGINKQRTIHTESLYAYMFQKLVGESEFLRMEKSYRERSRENKGQKSSRSYIAITELLNPQ